MRRSNRSNPLPSQLCLLSTLRRGSGLIPSNVTIQVLRKAPEYGALQTLRESRGASAVEKRLECGAFRRFAHLNSHPQTTIIAKGSL